MKFPGFFGTEGEQAREVFPQLFKIPHLRNVYTKIGMFGFNNLAPLIEVAEGYMLRVEPITHLGHSYAVLFVATFGASSTERRRSSNMRGVNGFWTKWPSGIAAATRSARSSV